MSTLSLQWYTTTCVPFLVWLQATSIRTYPEFSISFTTVSRWNLLYGAEAAGWSVFGPTIRPSCVYNDTQYMFLPNTPKDLFQWWLGQLLLVVVSDFG